jgi:hypothetical protein
MSPEAALALAASVVTVVGGVVALVRYLRRRAAVPVDLLLERRRPLDFEIVPIRFEVSTTGDVPRALMVLRAVNYRRKPLKLTSLRISYFRAHDRAVLDEVRSPDEYQIPPMRSQEVYCRRSLVEAETTLFRAVPQRTWLQGGCSIVAVGRLGKKEVRYEPGATFVIWGTVD